MSISGRAVGKSVAYHPGGGTVDPFSINNNAVFALFGLLGAGLVLTSIWFFFWARNGGFRFRKGDWDEYKSTVLRRKGPNGTTLSGATKTTDLGGGSVVGSLGSYSDTTDGEKAGPGAPAAAAANRLSRKKTTHTNRHDEDVRAYRHERVARVGGLNREADGAYREHGRSDLSSRGPATTAGLPSGGRASIQAVRASNPIQRQFSFSAGTEATFSTVSNDSQRPLHHTRHASRHDGRPSTRQQPSAAARTSGVPSRSRHSYLPSMPGSYTDPLDLDARATDSEAGSEAVRHTKAYFHPIPGLTPSGAAGPSRGFRRGQGGHRDDLSDSEDER